MTTSGDETNKFFKVGRRLGKQGNILMTEDETNDLLQLVMDGMKWNKRKAELWFSTPNPLLGGVQPNRYGQARGKDRLEKFIRNQLSENEVPVASNVDTKPSTINHESQAPAASNMGEELKPCPFCGNKEVFKSNGEDQYVWCGNQVYCGGTASLECWQNFWTHKRIAELERDLKLAIAHDRQPYPTAEAYEKVCELLHKKEAQVAQLQERNGELIETSTFQHQVILESEKEIADLEKRNDALELRHGRNQMAMFELEAKLKTAEDKLAAIIDEYGDEERP